LSLSAPSAIRRRMAIGWVVALGLGALAFGVARFAARTLPHPAPFAELAYYPSGRYLRSAVLGHAETAGDLAWLRAVQYYGEHRRSDNRFDQLDHVFDVLTTLAPGFEDAYVFGAFSLAQEGMRFDRGEQLLMRGIDRNPRSGWLAFQAGFLYYVKPGGRDLRHAAEYFERATHLPGSPASARHFAAYTRQNSGDLAMAYELWREVRNTSPNRYMHEVAEREMARIARAIETGRRDAALNHMTTPQVLLRAGG
jgi:hypothetical protein